MAFRRSVGASLDLPLHSQDQGDTFRDRFCADVCCTLADFEAEIFCRCLKPSGRLFAWAFGGRVHKVFAADLLLIHRAGDASLFEDVRAAIDDHWDNPINRKSLYRKLGARISTQRLRSIASYYVPMGGGKRRPPT